MSLFILALLGFLLYISEPSCIVLAQEMVPASPDRIRPHHGNGLGFRRWGVLALELWLTSWDRMGVRFLILPAGSLFLSPSRITNSELFE
jgi:hypothetical protein